MSPTAVAMGDVFVSYRWGINLQQEFLPHSS